MILGTKKIEQRSIYVCGILFIEYYQQKTKKKKCVSKCFKF